MQSRIVYLFKILLFFWFFFAISCGQSSTEGKQIKENNLNIIKLTSDTLKPALIPSQNITFFNQKELKDFYTLYGSEKVAPTVDFERYAAAGVFLGEKPNPGFSVKIINAKREKSETFNKTVIEFVEYLPKPNIGYIAIVVHPYDIIIFPYDGGEVIFSKSQQISN